MMQAGMMSAPEWFAIRKIKCAFYQGGEFVSSGSDLYDGLLELMVPVERVSLQMHLRGISAEDCRSVIATPPHEYGEGWLKYENDHHPVIFTLAPGHSFSFVLTLKNKPEVPTEFVTVLCGDHSIAVMDD